MNTRQVRHTTVLVVLGTRPEAIKLAPVISELRRYPRRDNPRVRDRPAQRNGAADP